MKINELAPNPDNPRTITDEKLNLLKKALKEFGSLDGFIYNRKTRRLAGGHQRQKLFGDAVITITKKHSKPTKTGTVAEGYVTLGNDRFPYREVYWNEHKETAANVAANKGAGEWDMPKLGEWMAALSKEKFDLDLTMFDMDELKQFSLTTVEEHTRVGATGVDEDEVPDVIEARALPGDIYIMNDHRLMCGDATDKKSIEKLMDGHKPHMVFTDPPYGMFLDTDYDSMFLSDKNHRKTGKRFEAVKGDHEDFKPELITTALEVFADCPEIFLWGADYYSELIDARKNGSWLVWDKRCGEQMDKVIGNTFELCWSKAKHKREIARILWSGHHGMQNDDTRKRVHPTQKPTKLAEWFFDQWGHINDNVVDLFGGSGSTLIACEKMKRTGFIMELDPHYVDTIVARWEAYTGFKSELVRPKIQTKKK